MPRTGRVPKRKIAPDPVYNSLLVAKLINKIMRDGKKALAQKIVYGAFDKINKETGSNPLEVFEQAIKMISPRAEVRPRRVGGATYMVPIEVRGERKQSLALRWLVEAARKRKATDHLDEKIVATSKLAAEIIAAAKGEGESVGKRDQIEKQAEANRAFAHFRW